MPAAPVFRFSSRRQRLVETRGTPWQLPRRDGGLAVRKASLTAKCPQRLQTPFLALFWLFPSHFLTEHPSLPCHRLAIAAACHGDICQLTADDNYLIYNFIIACHEAMAARFISDCWQLPRDVLSDNDTLSYVQVRPVTWLDKKEESGIRFRYYGALEPVEHDNPRSFLGLLWTVP